MLLRDLEEARARRIALENPPPEVVEEPVKLEPMVDVAFTPENEVAENDQPVPHPKIEEAASLMPLDGLGVQALDAVKDTVAKDLNIPMEAQGPSPPSSNDINTKAEAVDGDKIAPDAAVDLNAADMLDPAADLLTVSADNHHDDLNLAFDDMDFSLFTSNAGENSQSQQNDFLATFGNEDFSMPDMGTATNTENPNATAENKKEDPLELATNTAGEDMMDMEYFKPEESSFEELFGEESTMAEGSNMEHDGYDSAFFRLTD